MVSSRHKAQLSPLTMLIGAGALAAALSGCQSAAPTARDQGQPAAPILSSDSDAFLGLGAQELATALGKPRQVRKDAPAEIWQYNGADCVVDFYFYDSNGRLEVAYVEARDVRADNAPTERCVKSLLQSVSTGTAQQESL